MLMSGKCLFILVIQMLKNKIIQIKPLFGSYIASQMDGYSMHKASTLKSLSLSFPIFQPTFDSL